MQQPSQPQRRRAGDLPPLPDWPPLPEERVGGEWPPLGPALGAFAERDMTREQPQPDRKPYSGAKRSWRSWRSWLTELEVGQRWRGASRRRRIGVVAAVVLPLLIIIACAGFVGHTLGDLVGGAAAGGSPDAPTTQSLPGLGATPGVAQKTPASAATATSGSTVSAPTSTPASTATSPAVQLLTVAITCASGSQHGSGQLCVHTLPSATLSATVTYCDGSQARGLHSGAADASGNFTWNWQIRGLSCAGPATATVTAKLKGQTATATTTFAVSS